MPHWCVQIFDEWADAWRTLPSLDGMIEDDARHAFERERRQRPRAQVRYISEAGIEAERRALLADEDAAFEQRARDKDRCR
jgi:hypothetical protein